MGLSMPWIRVAQALHVVCLVIVAIGASCYYLAVLESGVHTRDSNARQSSCQPISLLQA